MSPATKTSATNPPETIRALDAVRAKTDVTPDIALILGSGLSDVADAIDGVRIDYADIPGLVPSTVHSHKGQMAIGTLHGRKVVAQVGRVHGYEGYSAAETTRPVRLMAALGAKTLIVTNAAGGLNPDFKPGDLVAIADHISLPNLTGFDPLRGAEERFVSMNGAYDPALLKALFKVGVSQRGVYCHVMGPSFETPAEVRMLRAMGGDMVGMSTVPEVMVARALKMRVCAVSGISNACVHSLDDPHVTTADEAWDAMAKIAPKMAAVLERLLPAI